MNFFPKLYFSVDSPRSESLILAKAHMMDVYIAGREYRLEELDDPGELLFYPESNQERTHNPFLPVIRLSIRGNGKRTSVTVRSRLRSRYSSFFSILVLSGFVIQAIIVFLCVVSHQSPEVYMLIPFLFSAVVYLTALGRLNVLSKRFFRKIKKELEK